MIVHFKSPEHAFLSNFARVEVEYAGVKYPSVEHAYQAQRSDETYWKLFCQSPNVESREIKIQAGKIKPVQNWKEIKVDIMYELLRQKFSKEPFKTNLLATGNQNIQEGNWWGDTFWGVDLNVDPNEGENMLGRLIMKIRDELKNK